MECVPINKKKYHLSEFGSVIDFSVQISANFIAEPVTYNLQLSKNIFEFL